MPSFTFVSSINPFVLRGARPVFADIREDTLCLDERQLERLITPRTRAIVVVHYAGVPCDMAVIGEAARTVGAIVIEDNAHGFLGSQQGKPLGTFGAMSALSFHDTKNITCGEGGALVINDPALIERAEILRQKGTDRSKFLRGQIDKYRLGRSGVELLAVRASCCDARRTARAGRVDPGPAPGSVATLCRWPAAVGSGMRCGVADRGAGRHASFHMFNLIVPSIAFRDGLFRSPARAWYPGGVALHSVTPVAERH